MKNKKFIIILVTLFISTFALIQNSKASLALCAYGSNKENPKDSEDKVVIAFMNNRVWYDTFIDNEHNTYQFSPYLDKVHDWNTVDDVIFISLDSGQTVEYEDMLQGDFYYFGMCPPVTTFSKQGLIDKDGYVAFYKDDNNTRIQNKESDPYYLYFDTVDFFYRRGSDTTTEGPRSGEILSVFNKIDSNNLCSLTDDEIDFLTDLFSMRYMTSGATGLEKHKLATYLGHEDGDSNASTGATLAEQYNYLPRAKRIEEVASDVDLCGRLKDSEKFAELTAAVGDYMHYYKSNSLIPELQGSTCNTILGDTKDPKSFAYYLQLIFTIIKYAGPILVVALTTFDYIGAVTSGSARNLKKVNNRTVIRIAAMLLLFLLPTIIITVLKIFNIMGDCGIR